MEIDIIIQAFTVAAVKKADMQRWVVLVKEPHYKRFTSIAGEIAGRKAIITVLSGCEDIWMNMTEYDREKMKGVNESLYIMSKNNNDHSHHWHAV